jgi:hypothetical protein
MGYEQSTRAHSVADGGVAQPGGAQLSTGDVAVLASCNVGDL